MPAQNIDPFPGFAIVRRVSALGGHQECIVAITGATSTEVSNAEPGQQFTLSYTHNSGGTSPDGVPNQVIISFRRPGTNVDQGSAWVINNPTVDQSRTIHLDEDPLNQTLGTPRAGMLEIHIQMIRTDIGTYNVDSRGNGADGNDEWCRGFVRSLPTLVSHSVSNVAIDGAEPALFAHADRIHVRATLDARFYGLDNHLMRLMQGGTIQATSGDNDDGPIFEWSFTAASQRVDADWDTGSVDLRLSLDTDIISGNNGTFNEYKWADSGHEAGWSRNGDLLMQYNARFDVDPSVSIVNYTHDQGQDEVYNRNEEVTGTLQVHNARGETFTPIGADTLTVRRTTTGESETFASGSLVRNGDVLEWAIRFGNTAAVVAPADLIGDEKFLRWHDAGASSSPTADSPRMGFLSSLLDIVDVQTSYENLTTTVYNRDETATITGRILNRRGQGFADWLNEVFDSKDSGTGVLEAEGVIVSHDPVTGAFEVEMTFAPSNNVAPADTVGAAKLLAWDDDSLNEIDTEYQYGFLSSLLDLVNVRTAHAGRNDTVYNRNETVNVLGRLLNRRGDPFVDVASEQYQSRNSDDGSLEGVFTLNSHDLATGEFDLTHTFAQTGNDAPADVTGAAKDLRWIDNGGNTVEDDQYAFLSSLLQVLPHLQLNVSELDPALSVTQRLTSDLGFYSIKIANQRGEGKNGVTVTDHFRDDADLTDQKDRTATTATINGHDGYLPLKAWENGLPGGGWDHWIDGGTFEGNTYEKTRPGTGVSDYVLLAKNPNFIVVAAGGHDTQGEDGLHWTPGSDLLVGCTMFDIALDSNIPVDDSDILDPGGQPYPRAYMIVARFNNALGTAEYFDSDHTWKSVEANQGDVHKWQLMSILRSNQLTGVGSVGDSNTYVHKFSEAETANWGLADLFFVPVVYKNSTPYAQWGVTGVTGPANRHTGYEVDAMALGLHGVLSTR